MAPPRFDVPTASRAGETVERFDYSRIQEKWSTRRREKGSLFVANRYESPSGRLGRFPVVVLCFVRAVQKAVVGTSTTLEGVDEYRVVRRC